jgi:hypothetical protein
MSKRELDEARCAAENCLNCPLMKCAKVEMGAVNDQLCAKPPDLHSFLTSFKSLVVPFFGVLNSYDFEDKTLLERLPEVSCVSSDVNRMQTQKFQSAQLILLRHSSKCIHFNGQCPVTPFCWGVKNLWLHILECKDQECKTRHCISSRYVLSHYSDCKVIGCHVCNAVHVAVKKNYERRVVKDDKVKLGSSFHGCKS